MNMLQVVICTPIVSADECKCEPHEQSYAQLAYVPNAQDLVNSVKELLVNFSKNALENYDKEPPLTQDASHIGPKSIAEALHELGMPTSLLGYKYLCFAIQSAVKEPEMLHSITKTLYPSVAKEFGTTMSNVERTMRHAIEVTWDRGNIDVLHNAFGYSINPDRGRPTNSEFISKIVDNLLIENS